eukprot:COSAG05_NODE_587_length_8516_cov_10.000356_4_plen_37_part_00
MFWLYMTYLIGLRWVVIPQLGGGAIVGSGEAGVNDD